MRKIDDNIVYALNTTIPTESFVGDRNQPTKQCGDLFQQLKASYSNREDLIKKCIVRTNGRLVNLTKHKEEAGETASLAKQLRAEQTNLRLLRKELNVEEVIQDRSTKIFHEKCRPFFRIPSTASQ